VAGQEGFLTVIQDGTGNRTFDMTNAAYALYGSVFPLPVVPTANAETIYRYRVLSGGTTMQLERVNPRTSGRDLLATTIISSSVADVDFVLTPWLSLYDRFEIDFDDVLPVSDNGGLSVRTSSNGGVSFDAGASDYGFVLRRNWLAANDTTNNSTFSSVTIILTDSNHGMSNAAGETAAGTIKIFKPGATAPCRIEFDVCHYSANFSIQQCSGVGCRLAAAAVNAVRVHGGVNFSTGSFRLFGVRK